MTPDVSVVIPVHNRREIATEAIDSVLNQEHSSFELIVVDDGSTDGLIDQLRTKYGGKHPELRLERIERSGVAGARNRGVSLARASMVAFLDSDDVWKPQKLARQCEFMRANPELKISQCQELWMRNGKRVNPAQRHEKRSGDIFIDSLHLCLVSPSSVILKTDLFRKMGGFDEAMTACEDYDLWLRIMVNHQVGLLDQQLVVRRAGHPDQLSATVPALDRFRIRTLLKLVALAGLSDVRRKAVADVLCEKCGVYSQGLKRRGNPGEAAHMTRLSTLVRRSVLEPSARCAIGHWLRSVPPIAAEDTTRHRS